MSKRLMAFSGALLIGAAVLAPSIATVAQDAPSGEITVLTHRTDRLEDGTYDRYIAAFNEQYPNVKVNVEAITDYEGEVAIRMGTDEYGDVLMIPRGVKLGDYPNFFEPLGAADEMSQKYRYVPETAYNGDNYGVAIVGNANGILYNTKVWAEAGITELPRTPEEFLADLQLIKDNTAAIPLYTNYHDGWNMNQWEGQRGAITADPEYVNNLAHVDAPFADGTDHNVIYGLLYDAVKAGLTEEDPTTTAWEPSKDMVANGEIATMVLGNWAIAQMQQKAVGHESDIGYMPFPHQVDGVFYSASGGDYKQGINIHSENKAAARAWLDWFADESGFAADEGGIPALVTGGMPATLAAFDELGVQYVVLNPSPAGEEGWVDAIDHEGEIGFWSSSDNFGQRLIDAARGATSETKDDIFNDLNTRWAAARAEVTGGN